MTRVGVSARTRNNGSLTYFLRWRANGKAMTKHSGIRTGPRPTKREVDRFENLAKEAALELQRELAKDIVPIACTDPTITVPRAVLAYLESISGLQAGCTVNAKCRTLDLLPDIRVGDVTADTLAEWTENRAQTVCDRTRYTEIAYVGAFLDWCVRKGFLAIKPTLPRPVVDWQGPAVVEDSQIRAAISAQTNDSQRLAVQILACTGLRNAELVWLPDSAVLIQGSGAILSVPKGERERTKRHGRQLPLGPMLTERIIAYRAERGIADRIIPSCIPTILNRWLRPSRLAPKQCRQWFLSALERDSCPDYVIRRLLGHAPDRTRRAYSFQLSDARPWMEKVEQRVFGA